MTKEEIEQAAESYLMDNEHNHYTAIRDGFKAGAEWVLQSETQSLSSENKELIRKLISAEIRIVQLEKENERLKAEREWILEFGNHLQAHIKVTPEGIEVIRAVNGWGDSVPLSEVKIFPSPPKQ
jgi:vacuolar-type H+-ATPase subunit I/STV1